MFWGRGDSSKLTDEQRKTLEHLRRLTETGHIMALDADQSALMVKALDSYRRLSSLVELGHSVKNIVLLVGFFAGLIFGGQALWQGFIR